ncbi:hypothetical protein F5Y16DRAFT_134296 [Xylariaceae sp. FL0255]|nr:hypothetical protein F5Y16DRAFT_134296 [Xylariaceae sp. FL0255]
MFDSRHTSPGRDVKLSRPESDADSISDSKPENKRKRPRAGNEREEREEPPTAACDQCRLRKVRCDRGQPECSSCIKAGIECNSSNTPKRVNYMKQLRDDFSGVLKQLSDIDNALGNLTTIARQFTERPCSNTGLPHPPTRQIQRINQDAGPSTASELLDFAHPTRQDDQQYSPGPASATKPLCETIKADQGGECLYSYPAPLVLMKSLLRLTTGLVHDYDQSSQDNENGVSQGTHAPAAVTAVLQRRIEEFPPSLSYRHFMATSDMKPVTTPPRLMVNVFIDGYLRNVNMRIPIFEPEELHRAIDTHYSDQQFQESRSWALIMNNIVLLELGLEIQTARASHSNSRATNDDILPSFLRNCDRAIANLDAFMAPSLANLKALMTLTLATREFYTNATAERVCHAACHVGRVMGIHRSRIFQHAEELDPSASNFERERSRLYRILYAMDKQRVFMTGQPCDLYMFDSDHQIGPSPSRGHRPNEHPISDAFDHLMVIWEEMYLNLYAPRAANGDIETRARQTRRVTASLDKFAQTHVGFMILPNGPDPTDLDLLRIELVYGYQVSRLLVLQREEDSEQSLNKMWDLARSSLKILLEACKPPLTTVRFALLTRLFRVYPIVAFVELVALRLGTLDTKEEFDPEALADVSLLRAVCDQLQTLQYGDFSHIFYARLSSGLVWALDTLEAVADALKRPSSVPHEAVAFVPQTKESTHNPQSIPYPITPAISDAGTHVGALHQRPDSQPQVLAPEEDFGQGRAPKMTSYGFYTPDGEHTDLVSGSPSSACQQPGAPSFPASQTLMSLGSGPMPGHGNWGDFNLDFFPENFAHHPHNPNNNRWE